MITFDDISIASGVCAEEEGESVGVRTTCEESLEGSNYDMHSYRCTNYHHRKEPCPVTS
jgi:hypothetical protein